MITDKRVISEFAREFNFDDIRPYYDHEVKAVLNKLIADPQFMKLVNYLWPERTLDEVKQKAKSVNTSFEFQLQFMNDAIHRIVEKSSAGLTTSGFDKLDTEKSYLFVANHRDIFLDAAILQIVLVKHGFPTSEISFGSNLKEKGFVTHFGKLNRMFTVLREGTSKELYEISRKLSAYVRHTIIDKHTSVWIAQRNGRTKDGSDMTQTGLLKMLNISGRKNFIQNFEELHIVPISISYEYEPCDYLKTQELYLSNLHTKYTKAPGEDLNSIVTGITQFKGQIHLAAGAPISDADLQHFDRYENENEKIKAMATHIDRVIYEKFACRPNNYVAADLLEKSYRRSRFYTAAEKQGFLEYMDSQLKKTSGEEEALEQLFLRIYGMPVLNRGE